jgi:hypothetical protein
MKSSLPSIPLLALLAAAAAPAARAELPAAAPPAPGVRGKFIGAFRANRFDVSRPLRVMARLSNDLAPLNPDEDRAIEPALPLGPQDPDGALQRASSSEQPAAMPAPTASFNAMTGTSQPPDSDGDVGPNHVIVIINSRFQILSKTGASLLGPSNINTIWSGFGGGCQTSNSGDPYIVYDNLADRWVVGQFVAVSPYFLCLAVSQTGDPTGSWYRYAIATQNDGLPDYPKMGMMPDAYYLSSREVFGTSNNGMGAYAINRAQALAGNPAAIVIKMLAPNTPTYNTGDGLHPADFDGGIPPPPGSPEYFLGHMDNGWTYGAPQDALTLWKFTPDWVTPANSTFVLSNTLAVAAVDTVLGTTTCTTNRQCIAQKSSANLIDHLGYRQRVTNRVAYRNFGAYQNLVTSVSVESAAGISGMRWYEIRSPNSSPVIFQQSTFSGAALSPADTHSRWMGSIAQDHLGDMGLAYSAASSTLDPAIRYTGRLAADPLNTMPQGEGTFIDGAGANSTGQRWGDYTAMNIDPDGCRFWYVNEYFAATGGTWTMRVGAFRFPGCADLPGLLRNAALTGLSPTSAVKAAIFPRAGDPSLAAADRVVQFFDTTASYPQETADYSSAANPIVFFQIEGVTGNTLRVSRNAAAGRLIVSY